MDISVIIPTLNEEKHIEDCLKAIRSQDTRAEYEIIVCDARSGDKTEAIAEKYADEIVLSNTRSIGIQRNLGAEHAKGDYLVFVDADTILSQNYLERVMEKFREDPGLLGFSTRFRFPKRDERLVFTEKIVNSYLEFRGMMGYAILLGFSTCVRKKVFKSLGGFKDVPLEDGEFGFRMRETGRTSFFTDFYVITSSRRLEEMGLLRTLIYYLEMDLTTRNAGIGRLLTYNEYVPCRVDNKMLQKEFARIFRPNLPTIDVPIREYIKNRGDELLGLYKVTREQFRDRITELSESIAELKLTAKVNKEDVDRAIKMIKERMK